MATIHIIASCVSTCPAIYIYMIGVGLTMPARQLSPLTYIFAVWLAAAHQPQSAPLLDLTPEPVMYITGCYIKLHGNYFALCLCVCVVDEGCWGGCSGEESSLSFELLPIKQWRGCFLSV